MDIKAEITKCLKKEDGSERWLLTEPHLLYMSNESAENYLRAMGNPQYSAGFHSETVEIISKNVNNIVGQRKHLSLIDLGPGFPDKALPIAKYCKERDIKLDYVPIDINESFLNVAEQEMGQFANNIEAIHAPFKECSKKIPSQFKVDALVMIGVTFMNFPSDEILLLMRGIGSGKNAQVLIASEVIGEKKSVAQILRAYESPEAREFAFGPLKAFGISSNSASYDVQFVSGRVEISFTLRKSPNVTGLPKGLGKGSKIITAISYRYTEDELRKIIQSHCKHVDFYWNENKTTVVGILN